MERIQVTPQLYRKEGLSWIIKAIWNLGNEIITSYNPNFLDKASITYFLSIFRVIKYTIREIEFTKKKLKFFYETFHLKIKLITGDSKR
jgi:hypothetical protein